jgi:hypothetical protein
MYTTETYDTRTEWVARYEALRGVPHLIKYTESVLLGEGKWRTAWIIAYPADEHLPPELRPDYVGQTSVDHPEKVASDIG